MTFKIETYKKVDGTEFKTIYWSNDSDGDITKAEKAKQRFENSGYTLFREEAGYLNILIYKKEQTVTVA